MAVKPAPKSFRGAKVLCPHGQSQLPKEQQPLQGRHVQLNYKYIRRQTIFIYVIWINNRLFTYLIWIMRHRQSLRVRRDWLADTDEITYTHTRTCAGVHQADAHGPAQRWRVRPCVYMRDQYLFVYVWHVPWTRYVRYWREFRCYD